MFKSAVFNLRHKIKMANNSMTKSEDMAIINVPKVAFRSFIHIAQGNVDNGNRLQTLCYLLGPVQKISKQDIWIDTVVIPKQTCSVSSVEDNGIAEKDTITFLREKSLTKNKEIFAWVHTRSTLI